MDLNITTKYNVGDVVYAAGHYYEIYPEREPYVVQGVYITADRTQTQITYEIIQNGLSVRIAESHLFPTFEECARWCKEKNRQL